MQAITGKRWLMVGSVAAAVATYYLLPLHVEELTRRTLSIAVLAALLWATEAIPLYATSLCVIGLQILLLAHDGGGAGWFPARTPIAEEDRLSYELFLSPFASHIIILFMGGFLLSAAVTRHRLDRAIAARVLAPFAVGPGRLLAGVMLITAFFSMWMSNTATTVMMIAIVTPLLHRLPDDQSRYARGLVLAVAFAANIGGIGTPIGTPPNAVVLAALHQAGHRVAFVEWMLMAVPLMLLLLAAAGAVLLTMFRPGPVWTAPDLREDPRPIDWRGRATLVILALAILLWLTGKWHGLASAAVALLAAAGLCATGTLGKRDVDSIDWNVLILMWGGLSLGAAMEHTGVPDLVVGSVPPDLHGWVLAAVVLTVTIVLGTFISNTATAIILVPMVIALPGGAGVELAILTGLASSFTMVMPVSTPPNAIAYATGRIAAPDLIRSGLIIAVLGVVLLLLGYHVMVPLTLGR